MPLIAFISVAARLVPFTEISSSANKLIWYLALKTNKPKQNNEKENCFLLLPLYTFLRNLNWHERALGFIFNSLAVTAWTRWFFSPRAERFRSIWWNVLSVKDHTVSQSEFRWKTISSPRAVAPGGSPFPSLGFVCKNWCSSLFPSWARINLKQILHIYLKMACNVF